MLDDILVGVLSVLLAASRVRLLAAAFSLIACTALADFALGSRASLGLLYVFPMGIAAVALGPRQIIALALLCSILRTRFDLPAPPPEVFLRFLFALLTYAGSGLFVIAILRNRTATARMLAGIRHEQQRRRDAEVQQQLLVDSSPATILTLDSNGVVLAANAAASSLFLLPPGETLKGRSIRNFLPFLADALRFNPGPAGLRTATQCQGFRENGEIFLASTWFSARDGPDGKHLAAIVVDSSGEMREQGEESLRQLLRANQIAVAAVSHEVRNLCAAIAVVSGNLRAKHAPGPDADLQALDSLVVGLERIASAALPGGSEQQCGPQEASLREVLDDLRIVILPPWREAGGTVLWEVSSPLPFVVGERHGLLQIFLNLAQNSLRAVQGSPVRELTISAHAEDEHALIHFADSGPGVASPELLFAPFQPGADGAGMGLYVSRASVRGYGGDLRWQPSGFTVQLRVAKE